ncbi:Protein-tyrosine-phosphatase [Ascochyta rabiei]|uniref:Protein-tyrosine-phosphatase n=1 Tax=Didymella rabiei TaxID=5454 RepID=UPI0022099528|nr:Protein-tyrosine-phosphatase [Ascochyta rabiei]UPX19193.1 Protein-tyrosine-phosphatase [Ascochyta rabiei]
MAGPASCTAGGKKLGGRSLPCWDCAGRLARSHRHLHRHRHLYRHLHRHLYLHRRHHHRAVLSIHSVLIFETYTGCATTPPRHHACTPPAHRLPTDYPPTTHSLSPTVRRPPRVTSHVAEPQAVSRHCLRAARCPPPVTIASPNLVGPPPPGLQVRLETDRSAFTLHKLRALRRKARLKGGHLSTDPAATGTMSAPSSVPVSPASSKRSRSKDSTRSATHAFLHTPAESTTSTSTSTSTTTTTAALHTPAMSTHSLLPPLSVAPSSNGDHPPDNTPYPAFLGPRGAARLDSKWNDLEWAQMNRLREAVPATDAEQPSPWARCCADAYAPRNRYVNVDPYQANRVHLRVPEGVFDYINASPITLHATKSKTALRYIATQGPKADTCSHFWRMLWAENESPAVIVMVTRTHEQAREKCYPYYPSSLSEPDLRINEHDEFGDGFVHNLHLAALSHDDASRTEIREIDMTTEDGSESRKVWHLLFEGWPDFSVPEGADKAALLKMVDLSRQKNSNNSTNPRIVHCSAGIGRSGTFIALDWLIQELEEGSLDSPADDQDPILRVVETLRDQRPMMVQSKQQFVFIYDTLRERWRERWISLHPDEASRLGISPAPSDDEPALKRQKSNAEGDTEGAFVSEEERAKLEAELMAADYE